MGPMKIRAPPASATLGWRPMSLDPHSHLTQGTALDAADPVGITISDATTNERPYYELSDQLVDWLVFMELPLQS
jgi:hypothetical protein